MSADSRRPSFPLPSGRGWWIVAAGIVLGLGVFLALWLAQRGDRDLYRADGEQPPAASAPAFEPLPTPPSTAPTDAPIPAGPASGARLEEPWEPAPPGAPTAPAVVRDSTGAAAAPDGQAAGTAASPPVPINSPSPAYPSRALRRGESGEVLLRVHVDARGVPDRVEVASSSGSRDLDRAAQRAVNRWRFRPAMRDGSPTAGVVTVPINFESRR